MYNFKNMYKSDQILLQKKTLIKTETYTSYTERRSDVETISFMVDSSN